MNIYLKAAIITLGIFLVGMYAIKSVDEQRISSLRSDIESSVMDAEATRLLFLYKDLSNDTNSTAFCSALDAMAKQQIERTFKLATALSLAQNNNVLGDYETLKRQYYLTNFELYMYQKQLERYCGAKSFEPVLYFYSLKPCPQCIVQGQVLDRVVSECPNVRVFAFPSDYPEPVLTALLSRYGVTSVPTIIVAEQYKLEGPQEKEKIKELAGCVQQ
jgi:hypothetical protein